MGHSYFFAKWKFHFYISSFLSISARFLKREEGSLHFPVIFPPPHRYFFAPRLAHQWRALHNFFFSPPQPDGNSVVTSSCRAAAAAASLCFPKQKETRRLRSRQNRVFVLRSILTSRRLSSSCYWRTERERKDTIGVCRPIVVKTSDRCDQLPPLNEKQKTLKASELRDHELVQTRFDLCHISGLLLVGRLPLRQRLHRFLGASRSQARH